MSDEWKPPGPSALDDTKWPEHLIAKAVEPGAADDRIHGYAALGDVAVHYRYSDLIYLSIVGDLPDERSSRLFHVALCSLGTPAVIEAPTHVSLLSRICGGTIASAMAAGLVTLTEQARQWVASHAELLAWLAKPEGALPIAAKGELDTSWLDTLEVTLRAIGVDLPLIHGMTRTAARIALLYEAGLRQPEQLEAALVVSRVPGIAAEALLASPQDLPLYPLTVPPFHYVDDQGKR